jgi:uncharacterized protein DUF6498
MTTTADTVEDWTSAWPDALAFAAGLGMAWWGRWTTGDLVWSLWLSSLVVGYATIVWTILRPGIAIARGAWRDGSLTIQTSGRTSVPSGAVAGLLLIVGGLFLLAFFTVHFGMFHFVHSQFLGLFFPIDTGTGVRRGMVGVSTYLEVARRYWWFLPSAFLAERSAFLRGSEAPEDDRSVTVAAILARKAANSTKSGGGMMAPYRNVVRMHLLIFFFAFAHFGRFDSFAVYAVVYAVYFFPWRLVRRGTADEATLESASSGQPLS